MTSSNARRIVDIDALRGFALLGILVVNSSAFASTYYGTGVVDPAFVAPLDHVVRGFVTIAFESKFYLLFSFLFGYSFTLQMAAAERAGAAVVPRFLRRLAGLLAIGIAHATLLFHGDILTTYAPLGLLLLVWRGWPARRALKVAILLAVATSTCYVTLGGLEALGGTPLVDAAGISEQAARAADAYRGSAGDVVAQRVGELPSVLVILWFVQAPAALGMFLVGLAAGRTRFVEHAAAHRPVLKRIVVIGFTVGIPGAIWQTSSSASDLFELAVNTFTAPLLSAAYAASLLLLFGTPVGRAMATRLAAAGRMALSNYLMQSVICAWTFTGYGLGLVGRAAPLSVLAIVLAIFALQLVASTWWLRRFSYGPVEWLLRAVTLASWPNLRATTPMASRAADTRPIRLP